METQPPLTLWPDQRDRAVRLAKAPGAVRIECDGGRADVASFGTPGLKHKVVHAGTAWVCDCDFYVATGLQCGHAVAVRYVLTAEGGGGVTDIGPRPGSPQVLYDAAVTREVALFDALLTDLCGTIQEPPYAGNGRPPVPLREQVFCAVQKVYSQLSSRRAKALHDRALEKAPSFAVSSRFLNREDATPVLTNLIHQSAMPLAALEHDFAVDSTGFRTTNFMPYCQDKHGERRQHVYLKAHAICGVKTNIITSIRVTASSGAGSGDSPNFSPLVVSTAEQFTIREVSADKAYGSKKNHWIAHGLGGQALIPFKGGRGAPGTGKGGGAYANASGLPGSGKLWRKAALYFQAHRDDFDVRYHKRSNVEATFSAVKRKLGDAVKSRNHTAQVNEVLCKALAYNLTVLIKTAYSLGIDLSLLKQNREVAGV